MSNCALQWKDLEPLLIYTVPISYSCYSAVLSYCRSPNDRQHSSSTLNTFSVKRSFCSICSNFRLSTSFFLNLSLSTLVLEIGCYMLERERWMWSFQDISQSIFSCHPGKGFGDEYKLSCPVDDWTIPYSAPPKGRNPNWRKYSSFFGWLVAW